MLGTLAAMAGIGLATVIALVWLICALGDLAGVSLWEND